MVGWLDADGVINVKDYGAKGDGTTNDTEAFRKAIAAAEKVFVPRGDFWLSGELQLQPDTHLFGLGKRKRGRSRIGRLGNLFHRSNQDIPERDLIKLSPSGLSSIRFAQAGQPIVEVRHPRRIAL